MNQADFDTKLKNKFPDEKYVVVYYGKNSSDTTLLKCLSCGRKIQVNTGELFRTRRKHICSKCYYKRQDTIKNELIVRERLEQINCTQIEFYMKARKGIRHNMVRYHCGKCGRLNTHAVANFLRNKTECKYCNKVFKDSDLFLEQLTEKFGQKFSLLTEYQNAKTSILVKCNNCGFIRKVKPGALLSSGHCPKCDDKTSKGETVIKNYLIKQKIDFVTQKYFKEWYEEIGVHYFDFYIPSLNLIIEYHGKQHFCFTPFFHKTEKDFTALQEKDELKKEMALKNELNYISISYTAYSDLKEILKKLFNSTTIPKGSRGKLLEIETIQNLG